MNKKSPFEVDKASSDSPYFMLNKSNDNVQNSHINSAQTTKVNSAKLSQDDINDEILASIFDEEDQNDKQRHINSTHSTKVNSAKLNQDDINDEILASIFAEEDQNGNKLRPNQLSAAEKARSERNRQKALLLRQSRLSNQQLHGDIKRSLGCSRIIDSGGGFLIEEESQVPTKVKKVEEPAPVLAGELNICMECDKPFFDSYLLRTYDYSACDKCRDSEDKHSVITKTQAKEIYLLSEADLAVREPILKCVVRKNPRNNRWGDMKLYLKLQIEQRALEVWGTPEALEEERELRETKREEAKRKRYIKKMKKLRQEVRSSLYEVKTSGHEHVFGPETLVSDESDTWAKTCSLCGYQMTFEKM